MPKCSNARIAKKNRCRRAKKTVKGGGKNSRIRQDRVPSLYGTRRTPRPRPSTARRSLAGPTRWPMHCVFKNIQGPLCWSKEQSGRVDSSHIRACTPIKGNSSTQVGHSFSLGISPDTAQNFLHLSKHCAKRSAYQQAQKALHRKYYISANIAMTGDSAHNPKLSNRKRIPLLCNQCKRRKVKCDRKLPCSSCVKHKVESACEYLEDQVMNHETAGTLMVFKRKQGLDIADPKSKQRKHSKEMMFVVNQMSHPDLDRGHSAGHGLKHPTSNPLQGIQPDKQGETRPLQPHVSPDTHPGVPHTSSNIPPNISPNTHPDIPPNAHPNTHPNIAPNIPPNLPPNVPPNISPNTHPNVHPNAPPNLANPMVHGLNISQPITNPPPSQMPFGPQSDSLGARSYRDATAKFGLDPRVDNHSQGFAHDMYTGLGAPLLGLMNGHAYTPAGIPGADQGISQGAEDGPEVNLDLDQPFDLYTGYSSVFREGGKNVNHGPFSWFTYIQKDKALRALWDVSNKQHREYAFKKVPEGHGSEEARSDELLLMNAAPATTGHNQVSPNTRRDLKATLNKKTLSLGLTVFEGAVDQSLDIIERLKLILPNKRALFLLIKRFFQVVYPYTCVIDETYFRGEISAILGPESKSEDRFDHINIRKRKDFATMGILLIVLRISYLSTFSNIRSENEDIVNSPYSLSDDWGLDTNGPATGDSINSEYMSRRQKALLFEAKYILTHPVGIDFMEYVQACLDQFSGAQKCSMSVLQCLIMQRIYSDVAPEETHSADGYDMSALNAACINIGYCLGIHRDLDYECGQELLQQQIRYANISRKIWFFLKLMDLKLAWQFGFPIMVDHNYSNIKGPFFTPGASNVLNDDMEIKLCSLLTWTGSFYRNFGEMMRRCLMLQDPLKVSELLQLMDMFEEKVAEDLGALSDYTSSGSPRNMYFPKHMGRQLRKSSSKLSFSSSLSGMKIEFDRAEMLKEKVMESFDFPFVKVLKLKVYLNMKHYSMSIFYHLFLNFEKSERFDLSFSYLSKILYFFCDEFIPEIMDLLLSSRSNFDSASTIPGLILNTSVISLIHRCNLIFFSIIARSRFKISRMKKNPDHQHLLQTSNSYRHRFRSECSLTNMLSDIVNYNISCLSRLNHRYYYAWRIFKTHTYVLKKTTSEDFDKRLTELDYRFIELTQLQIDQLLALCHECYVKIEQSFKRPSLGDMKESATRSETERYVRGEFNPLSGTGSVQNGAFPNGSGCMENPINTLRQPSNGATSHHGNEPAVDHGNGQALGPGVKAEPTQFQMYQGFPESIEDYTPLIGMNNFDLDFPETDLLWQQISDMKQDNKREFAKDAPNDISDKFFPLSPQQDVFPAFDMNGAFEGFANIPV